MQHLVGHKGKADKVIMWRKWVITVVVIILSGVARAQVMAPENTLSDQIENSVSKDSAKPLSDPNQKNPAMSLSSSCLNGGDISGAVSYWANGLGLYVYRHSGEVLANKQYGPRASRLDALFIDSQNRLREDSDQNGRLTQHDAIVTLEKNNKNTAVLANRFRVNANGQHGEKQGKSVSPQHLNSLWNNLTPAVASASSIDQRNYQQAANTGRFMFSAFDSDNDGIITDDKTMFPFVLDSFKGKRAHASVGAVAPTAQAINKIRGVKEQENSQSESIEDESVSKIGQTFRANISPLVVKAPSGDYDITFSDPSYREFRKHYHNRRAMAYSISDNGLVRGFNAGIVNAQKKQFGSNVHPLGAELWAYVPSSFLPFIQSLAGIDDKNKTYVDGRLFTFDVNIFASDKDHPGGWGTLLVAGVRLLKENSESETNNKNNLLQSSWIVLDVTNPENPPRLVAELANAEFATTTNVDIVKMRAAQAPLGEVGHDQNRWFLTFGSANTDHEQTAKLFIYSLKKGTLQILDSGVRDTVVTGVKVTDWNRDFVDDVIYYTLAGNTGNPTAGQLRRVSLAFSRSGLSTKDSAVLEGTGNNFSAAPYTRIDADYNYWVFATSEPNNAARKDSGGTKGTLYGLKEIVDEQGDITHEPIDSNALIAVEDIRTYKNGQVRTSSDNPVFLNGIEAANTVDDVSRIVSKSGGWALNFYQGGEKPTGQIKQYSTSLLWTTFSPGDNDCTDSLGTTWLYQREFFNGLSPIYGEFTENDKALSANSHQAKALSPVVEVGNNYFELISDNGLIQGADGQVKKFNIGTPNVKSRRESWRELDKSW